jgi:ferredoxin
MSENVYEKLREKLDALSMGYPKTDSGIEIRILKKIYNEEEAGLALELKLRPQTPDKIASQYRADEDELAEKLYALSRKGGIYRTRRGESLAYSILPYLPGIYEFQLGNLDKEFVEMHEEYTHQGLMKEAFGSEKPYFKVIPAEKEIPTQLEIFPYESVASMIERATKLAVADCICRVEKNLLGEGCDKPVNACMMFSEFADFYIENGLAREVTREEAKQLLDEAEEAGLVHCSMNTFSDHRAICNCCGCCCGILRGINEYNYPNSVAKSNFYAQVDADSCTNCEICVDRCQVDAIICDGDYAVVDVERCIGCGICVSTCPTEAISFPRKPEEEFGQVSKNIPSLFMEISEEKNRPFTI